MTERDWLLQLYEDVRAYFRYEAEPQKQLVREAAMRQTMFGYQIALQDDDARSSEELLKALRDLVAVVECDDDPRREIKEAKRVISKFVGTEG